MSANRAASRAAISGGEGALAVVLVVLLALLLSSIIFGARARAQRTQLEHDQIAAPPTVVNIPNVQITTRPDSEGGGELVYMQLPGQGGFLGPFLKLPSLPQGVGYGTTEVSAPTSPASPPCLRGHWARDSAYFYMCLSVSSAVSATGTRWHRLRWDPWQP